MMLAKTRTSPTMRRRPSGKRAPKLISLSGAQKHFRVNGKMPTRSNLFYHLSTSGKLKPNKTTALPTGGNHYGFTRSRLQAFARLVGWEYVA